MKPSSAAQEKNRYWYLEGLMGVSLLLMEMHDEPRELNHVWESHSVVYLAHFSFVECSGNGRRHSLGQGMREQTH